MPICTALSDATGVHCHFDMAPSRHSATGRALLHYMLITALRDRLFLALPVMMALAAALTAFLSGSALIEQREMAASFFGAGSRVLIIFGMVIFICFHIRQAMDSGEIALILSRPISRGAFVLVYGASMVIMGIVCVAIGVILLWICARPPLGGLLVWGASMALETSLMILTTLFFGLILNSAVTAALASLGFYFLARMSGLLGILAGHASTGGMMDQALGKGFILISFIVPRLDLFSRSEWLVYGWNGQEPALIWSLLQSLAFIPLVLGAAAIDFSRKRL